MKTRLQALEVALLREFDLVVVGGGIVGAGIAQDAASRGMSVLVIEKHDFASGTSSKTSKLIQGGWRYLEQLNFQLTRQLCRERGVLKQLAPNMVRDFSFLLPITKQKRLLALKARLGLTVYDLLSFPGGKSGGHLQIGQREVLESCPALSASLVVAGLRFHDCITDDSRLVLEVLKSAIAEGANIVNYLEVTDFQIENGRVVGVHCHDRYNGSELLIACKSCVIAAGVWSDRLMRKIESGWKPCVSPAKGIHITVPPSALETNTALCLPSDDNRCVFVVPWQRSLMIGSTDRPYRADIDNPLPDRDEIDYLLHVVNQYTSGKNQLNRSDVTAGWAGLRPQVQPADNALGDASSHAIFDGPAGVVTLVGGKFSNYRIMAGEVVEKILQKFPGHVFGQSKTRRLMLGGWSDRDDFLTTTAEIAAKARRVSIEPATLDHLIASYGKDAQLIVDIVENKPSLNQRICPDFPNILAEVPFCVLNEMAVSLEDLLFRRLRLALLHQRQCLEAAPRVAQLMQSLLSWDDARTALELAALEKSLNEHLSSFLPVPSLTGN